MAEFTNYCNETSREIFTIIHSVNGGWQYDDSNQTDLPSASATLTSGQTNYALPSLLMVKGIEVKDTSGIWHSLTPITDEQIRNSEFVGVQSGYIGTTAINSVGSFMTGTGLPLYYTLVGQTVKIYPAASWTQASSFKVFYDRGSVSFLTTDTTKEPGFASEFHDLIHMGASIRWFEINSPEDLTYQRMFVRYEQKKEKLYDFYKMQSNKLFPQKMSVMRQNNR